MAWDWQSFGLVLALELLFALLVAWLTRYLSDKRIEGQTYSLVVLGVAGVVTIAGGVIGWENVAKLALCFVMAALPMGVEYYQRVIREWKDSLAIMEGWLDGHPGASRKERIQGCDCGGETGDPRRAVTVEKSNAGKQECQRTGDNWRRSI